MIPSQITDSGARSPILASGIRCAFFGTNWVHEIASVSDADPDRLLKTVGLELVLYAEAQKRKTAAVLGMKKARDCFEQWVRLLTSATAKMQEIEMMPDPATVRDLQNIVDYMIINQKLNEFRDFCSYSLTATIKEIDEAFRAAAAQNPPKELKEIEGILRR